MVQELSAGAIIFRREGGKRLYLLLHYESGHWDLVKGHVEKGETIEETVKREAMEEAGLRDLSFIHGFKEKIHYFFKRGKTTVSKDVIFLLAETRTPRITLSDEHVGYEWLHFEDALKKITFDTAKSVLKKAEGFFGRRPKNLQDFSAN